MTESVMTKIYDRLAAEFDALPDNQAKRKLLKQFYTIKKDDKQPSKTKHDFSNCAKGEAQTLYAEQTLKMLGASGEILDLLMEEFLDLEWFDAWALESWQKLYGNSA